MNNSTNCLNCKNLFLENQSIHEDLDKKIKEIEDIKKGIQKFTKESETASKENKDIKDRLNEVEAEKIKIEKDCRKYKDDLILIKKTINSVQNKENNFIRHIAETESRKKELEDEKKNSEDKFKQISADLAGLKIKNDDLQQNLKKKEIELVAANEKIKKLAGDLDIKQKEETENLKKNKDEKEKLVLKIESLDKELLEKNALKSELSEVNKSLNEKKKEIDILNENNIQINKKFEETQNKYKEETKKLKEKETLVNDYKKNQELILKEKDKLSKLKDELNQKINDKDQEIKNRECNIADLKKEIESTKEYFEKENQSLNIFKVNLEKEIENLLHNAEGDKNKASNYENICKKLEEENINKTNKISDLQEKLQVCKESKKNYKKKIKDFEMEKFKIYSSNESSTNKNLELEGKYKALEEKYQSKMKKNELSKEKYKTKIKNYEETIQKEKEISNDIKMHLSKAEAKELLLEQMNKELDILAKNKLKEIENYNNQINDLKNDIKCLTSDNKKKIKNLKLSIQDLNIKSGEKENLLNEQEKQIKELTLVNNDIDKYLKLMEKEIQSKNSKIEDDIVIIRTLKQNEENLSNINKELEYLLSGKLKEIENCNCEINNLKNNIEKISLQNWKVVGEFDSQNKDLNQRLNENQDSSILNESFSSKSSKKSLTRVFSNSPCKIVNATESPEIYNSKYDLIIDIPSFSDICNCGWQIEFPEKKINTEREFLNLQDEKCSSNFFIGILGGYCKGKTFFLNKLTNNYFPSGKKESTKGISITNWNCDSKKCLIMDTVGFDFPINMSKDVLIKRRKTENNIQDLVCEVSNILIFIVNDFTIKDQKVLERIRENTILKSSNQMEIIVIHNLKDVNDKIVKQDTLNQIYSIYSYEESFCILNKLESTINNETIEFFQTTSKQKNDRNEIHVRHLIFLKDDCDYGRKYNLKVLELLKSWINSRIRSSTETNFFDILYKYLTGGKSISQSVDPRNKSGNLKIITTKGGISILKENGIEDKLIIKCVPNENLDVKINVERFDLKYDIIQTNKSYKIIIDIPGIEKKSLSIKKNSSTHSLRCIGRRDKEYDTNPLYQGRKFGEFSQVFVIPTEFFILEQKIKIENGTCKIEYIKEDDQEDDQEEDIEI